jgi:hypothetical protein
MVATMRSHDGRAARWWSLALAAAVAIGVGACDPWAWLFGEPSEQCQTYCAKMVECKFDSQSACETTCQDDVDANRSPEFEDCVMTQDCAPASRCILCQQYCAKLTQCGVSTDTNCQPSCDTNLASGADSGKYQCVVDGACSDISNCGV